MQLRLRALLSSSRLAALEKVPAEALFCAAEGMITCFRPGFRLPGGRNAKTHIYEHGCRFYNRACV